MSGSPKFSEAEIAEWKQRILEAERKRRAEIEAIRRQEAEEKERIRQLEISRSQIQVKINALLSELHWQWANLYQQEAVSLQYRCQNQLDTMQTAESEIELLTISQELSKIELAIQQALYHKRWNEAEKKRQADIERQQFELEELQRQVAQIPEHEAIQYDAAGRQQVLSFLENLQKAIAAGDPKALRRPLAQASAIVQKHVRQVSQKQTDRQNLAVQANQQLSSLLVILAGLQADPVVMRWQKAAVIKLEKQVLAVQQAIINGQFQEVISCLNDSHSMSQTIIETANIAQLQAEKRDYIAASISESLQSMGFDVTFHQPEHPDHPASAMILGATTQKGKLIGVSVPIAGQVLYDVDGYVKNSFTTVDGNTAAVCDEAEQVITQIHTALESQYGIMMGELQWQGKDPERVFRQALQLPQRVRSRTL